MYTWFWETVWFWDPFFHTEDNWGTHMYLLQKVQMLAHALEGNMIKEEQGVNNFEQNVDVYIFLILLNFLLVCLCNFVLAYCLYK